MPAARRLNGADMGQAAADRETPVSRSAVFRGNKAALPSKPCVRCGRPMTWRRRWAKSWADVKYCSDACRRRKAARG